MKMQSADPDMPTPRPKRAYNQGARARAAEATAERIVDVFRRRICADWFDEITLEQIAREAEVTVPTVVRRFGGKEGLLDATQQRLSEEILARRSIRAGDVDAALNVLIEDYESTGDLVMRVLSQEDRHPPFRAMADVGRRFHRAWIDEVFAPWLKGLSPADHQARLDALVCATDLYIWKLACRDMGRTPAEARALMAALVQGVLRQLSTSPVIITALRPEEAPND